MHSRHHHALSQLPLRHQFAPLPPAAATLDFAYVRVLRVGNLHVVVPVDRARQCPRLALEPLVEPTLPVHPHAALVRLVLAEVEPVVHETLRAARRELVEGPLGEARFVVWCGRWERFALAVREKVVLE